MWNSCICAAILLMLVGCSESPAPSDDGIRTTLADQLQSIEAMTNQGHPPEKASALYLDYFSAEPIVLPYGGVALEGRLAVSEFYTAAFSMGTLVRNSYTEPTIGISNEYVVRSYEGTAQVQLPESEEILKFTNVYTDVLVYEDGNWKIQWHSWVPAPTE